MTMPIKQYGMLESLLLLKGRWGLCMCVDGGLRRGENVAAFVGEQLYLCT